MMMNPPAISFSKNRRGNVWRFFTVIASFLPGASLFAQSVEADLPLPEAAPKVSQTISLIELLDKGGVVMYVLAFAFLLLTLMIMIYLLVIRRGSFVTGKYLAIAEAMLKKRDFLGLLALSNRHHEASAQVLRHVLDFGENNPGAGMDQLREIAQAEGGRHVTAMNQKVSYLADLATLAPMLGLLGTVVGIIRSFGVLASDEPQSSSLVLAGGVAEALVTTGAGLIIGILSAAFYAIFRSRVQRIAADFESGVAYLMALYAQYKKNPDETAAAGPRRLSSDF